MKECRQCKKILPAESFFMDRRSKDGLMWHCKSCDRLYRRKMRRLHPESHKARDKRYYKTHTQKILSKRKMWLESNTHKRRAHEKVKHALALGTLTRPEHCTKCLSARRLYAHHPDYGKPLDVVWLCASCHQLAHRAIPTLYQQ